MLKKPQINELVPDKGQVSNNRMNARDLIIKPVVQGKGGSVSKRKHVATQCELLPGLEIEAGLVIDHHSICLLYTSDAADE